MSRRRKITRETPATLHSIKPLPPAGDPLWDLPLPVTQTIVEYVTEESSARIYLNDYQGEEDESA